MFIRRTQTRNRVSGEPYITFRLVHSARVGGAIKQTTLLNLGSHFDLPQAHWPALAQRFGRCGLGLDALRSELRPNFVACQHLIDALVERAYGHGRRPLGSKQTIPGDIIEAGIAGLGHGGNVWQAGAALGRHHPRRE